mmetsp:Transcript_4602/g.8276  ORF Transcript_4602/g.8276 Transcript_4602/m.8276 type:complete len:441 (+) Transcript_4602:163-1485(+)
MSTLCNIQSCSQVQVPQSTFSALPSPTRNRSRSPRRTRCQSRCRQAACTHKQALTFGLKDAMELVASNKKFYHKRHMLPVGTVIDMFNYRQGAREKDFFATEVGLEMRGLCFVDGKRFLALPKFFNLDEVSSSSFQAVKDKTIVSITEKVDGSLIRFIRVGDALVAKSKMCLDNEMTKAANDLLASNAHLHAFAQHTLERGIAAHFEYVGPTNQIVLFYEVPRLVLHSARCERTGRFLDLADIADGHLDVVTSFPIDTLQRLKDRCMTEKGREGYVIQFSDGQLVKMKTLWYLERHAGWQQKEPLRYKVHGVELAKGAILKMILNNTLDDIKSQCSTSTALREELDKVEEAVLKYLSHEVEKLQALIDSYGNDLAILAAKCKAQQHCTFLERVMPTYLHSHRVDEEELFECVAEDMRRADAGTGLLVQMLAPSCKLQVAN